MIRGVTIHPNVSAKKAEELINHALLYEQNEDTEVDFELLIENSVMVGSTSATTYTVVIQRMDAEEK